MRSTIRQVAEKAGVSAMTVSNVLRGRDAIVVPEKRERVLKAARELNYIPVRSTLQNRGNETRIISLMFDHPDMTHHQMDMLTYDGLGERARLHGYDLLIVLRNQTDWVINTEELRFLDRRSDGFIFVNSGVGGWQNVLEKLAEQQIPTLACYRRDLPTQIPWVDPDNEDIVRQSLQHLIAKGHTRIGHLAGPRFHYDSVERHRYFETIMPELGLEVRGENIEQGVSDDWHFDQAAMKRLLSRGLTAIFCFNNQSAMHLWNLAEQQGLRIPQDLSLIAAHDTNSASQRGLSTVGFDWPEVGRLAIDAWMDLKNGAAPQNCCRLVPVQLNERASVLTLRDAAKPSLHLAAWRDTHEKIIQPAHPVWA